MKKKILIGLLIILLIGLGLFFFVVPARVEQSMNVTLNPPPYEASSRAHELHERILIADLHADSLLWDRDLNERAERGHVDVPRLIEGNVALQAFTVVTKTPRGMNIESNDGSTDNITLLALAQ
ncbi:MAG TPA: peptidase M19, partial [Blastocatellia bacterium]|nr:peptidase M19 [Blastocatellia bacterium]